MKKLIEPNLYKETKVQETIAALFAINVVYSPSLSFFFKLFLKERKKKERKQEKNRKKVFVQISHEKSEKKKRKKRRKKKEKRMDYFLGQKFSEKQSI